LPPVSKTAYIKLFPRKGSGIKPDFSGLSTPDFLENKEAGQQIYSLF